MSRKPEDVVLDYFRALSKIPRRSRHEDGVRRWIQGWAQQHGFNHQADAAGNVVVEVPGSPGCERMSPVVLQGHMDMVCEKTPTSDHDFAKDPIQLLDDGDWIRAKDTSLGADNGIGVSLAMALATAPDVKHPPLELLFTVDEETGLTGANALQPGFLKGKTLLNLDSEDEGIFTIGCAGGRNATCRIPIKVEKKPNDAVVVKLAVSGLLGGHSGVDIHRQRANAIQLLIRTVAEVMKDIRFHVASATGGSAHNAIPRDASAFLCLQENDFERASRIVNLFSDGLRREYSGVESNIQVSLQRTTADVLQVTEPTYTARVVDLLLAMPHGVSAMATAIPGLVETSNNFATLKWSTDGVEFISSHRSSVISRLDAATQKTEALVRLSGGSCELNQGYPPWEPQWKSQLLELCRKIYRDHFGKDAVIEVIHAGLECGVIGSKYPGMEMISFGPTIKGAHSPDERLLKSDLPKIWALSVAILGQLSDRP